jgi:hypothetical protein
VSGNDGSVRLNGSGFDVRDVIHVFPIGELDGCKLLALVGEHLDARVEAMVLEIEVRNLTDVEINRRRAGGFGVGGHFQFVVCGLLELGAKEGRREKDKEQQRKHTD